MRNTCINIINSETHLDATSLNIDANQIVAASFHLYFSGVDPTTTGDVFLEGSNDTCSYGNLAQDFTVTNWSQIDVVSGSAEDLLFTIQQNSYRWLRMRWVDTASGKQRVTIPDGTVFADLASTYFFFFAPTADNISFVFWISVGGDGSPPDLPGDYTYIEVAIEADYTIEQALGSLKAAFSSANFNVSIESRDNAIDVTNMSGGAFQAGYDFNTGFTFQVTEGGLNSVVINMNAIGA